MGVLALGAAGFLAWGALSSDGPFSAGGRAGAFHVGGKDRPRPLLRRDGRPIRRSEVPSLYGKPDGVTVLADGTDVTSPAYAAAKGIRPLVPRGWDLSEAAGWPEAAVPPGVLAIDPETGRVKFSAGESRKPETVAHLHTGFGVPGAGRPAVKGRYVVLPAGEGDLTVMDLARPEQPRVVAFIPTDFFYFQVHWFRDSLFLDARRGGKYTGLALVRDFSDPARPGEAAMISWRDEWGRGFRGVLEEAALAYASSGDWVFVMDVSDPERVREVSRVRFKGLQSFRLAPGGKFAVAVVDKGRTIGLISLQDPRAPVLASYLPNLTAPRTGVQYRYGKPPPFGQVMEVWDEGFALRAGFGDLAVFQITRGAGGPGSFSVKPAGRISLGEEDAVIRDVLYHDSRLYVADGRRPPAQRSLYRGLPPGRLFVVDLRPPGGPAVAGKYTDPDVTEYSNLGLLGETLLVNDYNFGLWTFDISRPERPVKIGGQPSAAEGRFAHVAGERAYIAHTFGGTIVAADISDPLHPKRLGYYWDGVWMNYKARLAEKDGYLYVPKDYELTIVDFRDPGRPVRAGEFTDKEGLSLHSPFILVSGSTAYVASVHPKTGRSSLATYDLKDPGRPERIASVTLLEKGGAVWRMALSGGRLYLVPAGGGRLWVYDGQNPADLKPLGRFDRPAVYHEGQVVQFSGRSDRDGAVAAAKGFAYVTLGGKSPHEPAIFIFDVRDPARPLFSSLIRFPEEGWQYFYCDVAVYGGYLFGAEYHRLHVFSLERPDRPELIHTFTRTGGGLLSVGRVFSYQWTLGDFRGGHLFVPKLDGLDVFRIPTLPEFPAGKVEIRARF